MASMVRPNISSPERNFFLRTQEFSYPNQNRREIRLLPRRQVIFALFSQIVLISSVLCAIMPSIKRVWFTRHGTGSFL